MIGDEYGAQKSAATTSRISQATMSRLLKGTRPSVQQHVLDGLKRLAPTGLHAELAACFHSPAARQLIAAHARWMRRDFKGLLDAPERWKWASTESRGPQRTRGSWLAQQRYQDLKTLVAEVDRWLSPALRKRWKQCVQRHGGWTDVLDEEVRAQLSQDPRAKKLLPPRARVPRSQRVRLALLRIVAPLAADDQAAFIERSALHLTPAELRRFIAAGVKRELILLDRPSDLERAQQISMLTGQQFYGVERLSDPPDADRWRRPGDMHL